MPVKKTRAVVARKTAAKKSATRKPASKATGSRMTGKSTSAKARGGSALAVQVVPATLRFDVNDVIWIMIQRHSNGIRIGPPRPSVRDQLARIRVDRVKPK